MEADMLCTIDDEMFHSLKKNIWIGNLGDSCYIINVTQKYDAWLN